MPSIPVRVVALFLLSAVALLSHGGSLAAQEAFDVKAHYAKAEYQIPMRDGVKLHTIVYTPRDVAAPAPFLLLRTPYGIGPYGEEYRKTVGPSQKFAEDKFIFVYQDVRGQYKSEGTFVVMRPILTERKPQDADESTDTFDTIEWLLKNVPNNNGRVGQWGISYPGTQTVWGMIDAHPALKASSPQAPAIDMYLGDDFHHNGAFRLMYTFNWLAGNARARTGPSSEKKQQFDYGTPDSYRFFMEGGTLSELTAKHMQDRVPTWNEYMAHPDYDEYWQKQTPLAHLKNINHAVLNVGGWFDAEDFYGPIETYRAVEKLNPKNQNTLVIGPWLHGGWNSMPGDALGDIRFGSKTAEHYRNEIEFTFFKRHLKPEGTPSTETEAVVFETGANVWRQFDQWPPAKATEKTLYLQPGGRVGFTPPAAPAKDSYISDPARPVPFTAETRPIQGHLWMVEDQRFAARRPDVLVYETEPLTEDVVIAGPIIASLWASSTGSDADFVVKLIDVYPPSAPDNQPNPREVRMGDYQMLLAGEVFRAKYRNSFSQPEPLAPGVPAKIEFDLRDRFHRFLKGHRIMVQVQSSWFPVIDRNPQQFLNIYAAKREDYQPATQTIHLGGETASKLTVRVLAD